MSQTPFISSTTGTPHQHGNAPAQETLHAQCVRGHGMWWTEQNVILQWQMLFRPWFKRRTPA